MVKVVKGERKTAQPPPTLLPQGHVPLGLVCGTLHQADSHPLLGTTHTLSYPLRVSLCLILKVQFLPSYSIGFWGFPSLPLSQPWPPGTRSVVLDA